MSTIDNVMAIAGPILDTGGQLLGQHSANKQNKKLAKAQREWNEKMYRMQRQDEVAFWRMQNEYNSPQAQMARLKEAGLSPHLVYGSSAPGGAGGNMSTPSPQGYSRADVESVSRGMDAFKDIIRSKNINAQTDNVKTNSKVQEQKAIGESIANIKRARDTRVSLKTAKDEVRKFSADADKAESEADQAASRARVMKATEELRKKLPQKQLDEISARIKKINKEKDGQSILNDIRKIERDLSKKLKAHGLTPSDNVIVRLLATHKGDLPKILQTLEFVSNMLTISSKY